MNDAAIYYAAKSPELGYDFLDDVYRVIDRLREYPQAGFPVDTHIRRMLLARFPFSLLYGVAEDLILIVAVAHQGRKPGHWNSRIEG
jgi:plasmid stabilization system protein ParE